MRVFRIDYAPGVIPDLGVDDVLATARNLYQVREVRPVDSVVWPNRWRVETVLIGPHDNRIPAGARPLSTYPRGTGPVEFFGPWPEELP